MLSIRHCVPQKISLVEPLEARRLLAFSVGSSATIQAEDFDDGGQGVSFYDVDSKNQGGQYRNTPVDIVSVTDTGGGYAVGYTRPGEWLNYTINVEQSGSYNLEFRIASGTNGGKFRLEFAGVNKTGSMNLANTGGWNKWTTISKNGVSLGAGTQVMRLFFESSNTSGQNIGDVNWIKLTRVVDQPPPPPPPSGSSPFNGVIPIPGTIQAENFDNGGQGVSFWDSDSTNKGGVYRNTPVDILSVTDSGGGYGVGWTKAGEWLTYTVNVAESGTYNFDLRAASGSNGGKLYVELNGVNITGTLSLNNTGGWNSWKTISKSNITLSAGTYTMKLVFASANTSGQDIGNVNWMRLTQVSQPPPPPPPSGELSTQINWTIGSPSSPVSRVEPGVVRVGNKLFVMGGYYNGYKNVSGRVDILDMSTGKWSRGADLPGTKTHAGVASDGKYIYWVSGQYGAHGSTDATKQSWKYEIATNKWSSFVPLPEIRFGGGMAFHNGALHFFGGSAADRHTAMADHWVLRLTDATPTWRPAAPLPRAKDHMGVVVHDGMIYSFGGEHDHGISYIQHKDVYRYNPATDAWTRLADMPLASSHFEGNILLLNGQIVIMGGRTDNNGKTAQVISYNPATNGWRTHTSMPAARMGGASWVWNGKLHFTVGDEQSNGQPITTFIGTFV